MSHIKNKIPSCKGNIQSTMDGDEFDCEYDTDIECDHCICVTSQFNDFTGIDPRTNKQFKKNEK